MKKLLFLFPFLLQAQLTTITRTVTNVGNIPASGYATITLSQACYYNGVYTSVAPIRSNIVVGAFSVALVPNDNCLVNNLPNQTYYRVEWVISGQPSVNGQGQPQETWFVPTSAASLDVHSVLVNPKPPQKPLEAVSPMQIYQFGAQVGQGLCWNGIYYSPGGCIGGIANLPGGAQTQFLRIKPNAGNNTTYQFSTLPTINTADYNFPIQTPGGSLSIGTCSFNMAPLPLGVTVDDFLYISGGTGTAEALEITGIVGSNVTANCTSTHTGAWTVQSASAGIMEAWSANGPGWTYTIPNGAIPIYALILYVNTGESIILQGSSHTTEGVQYTQSEVGGTTLVFTGTPPSLAFGAAVFVVGTQGLSSGQLSIRDLSIIGNSNTTHGLFCNLCNTAEISNVLINGVTGSDGDGFLCAGCVFATVKGSRFANNSGNGATFIQGGNGGGVYSFSNGTRFVDNCQSPAGAPCAGLFVNGGYGLDVGGTSFEGSESLFTIPYATGTAFGIEVINYYGFSIHGSYCERNRSGCIGVFDSQGFDISGNTILDSPIYIDPTVSNGTIHGNAFEAADSSPVNVSAVNNNGGFCEITTAAPHGLTIYSTVYLNLVGGSGCNGTGWVVDVESATQYTVVIPFSGTYTTGGTSQAFPGIIVTPGHDIKVSGNDVYNSPGPAAFYTSGVDFLHGIGPPIASLSVIVPTYDVHHITGTNAIVTINPPTSLPSGFSGTFCGIPDGLWTTTNAGNIAIASTAVVGKQLCWTYDPGTAKWYPSY